MTRPIARKLLIAGLALVLLLGTLSVGGCGSSDEGTSSSLTTIVTYTIADSTGDWGYPSPYLRYSRGPGYIRSSFIFDTFIWKDEDGFIPALAKEWSYDETENAYTLELQENALWHDGEPFTAEDVAFTVD